MESWITTVLYTANDIGQSMKVAVSMPKAENFDWDATYYALLSIGMYRTRVWGVGKSVDSLKQTVCESIDKTRGKVQANLLKKDI